MKAFITQISFSRLIGAVVIARLLMGSTYFVDAILVACVFGYGIWQSWWEFKLDNYPKPVKSLVEIEQSIDNLKLAVEELKQRMSSISLTAGFTKPPTRNPHV